MKSFNQWHADEMHRCIVGYSAQDCYDAGIHEGIAEGRRLERESMRCESCVFLKKQEKEGKIDQSRDKDDPLRYMLICRGKTAFNGTRIMEDEIGKVGCIHHERKTE